MEYPDEPIQPQQESSFDQMADELKDLRGRNKINENALKCIIDSMKDLAAKLLDIH